MRTTTRKNLKRFHRTPKDTVVLKVSSKIEESYKRALAERKDAVTITNIDSYFKTLN